MTIKFPKVHIATSVVNRILNIADGLPDSGSQASPVPPVPDVPDVETQSDVLNESLAGGVTEPLPGLDQAPDPGGTVSGKPLLATVLNPKP